MNLTKSITSRLTAKFSGLPTYDLCSLGCILYHLLFGSPICNAEKYNWGYGPPEVSVTLLNSEQTHTFSGLAAYDLWSLGCILYHLLFGSPLWNVDNFGKILRSDLTKLAKWSPQSFLTRALHCLQSDKNTKFYEAAVDLASKLLAPTPEGRQSNFEFGIVSNLLVLV